MLKKNHRIICCFIGPAIYEKYPTLKSVETQDLPMSAVVEDLESGFSGAAISDVNSSRKPPADIKNGDTTLDLVRKLCAEFLGTALLAMAIVGSGIMAENLSADVGVQLFIASAGAACGLYGIITIFGPVSGGHFNPAVTMVDVLYKDKTVQEFALYVVSQVPGGIVGAVLANIMFEVDQKMSTTDRYQDSLWLSEVIATATLILVIHGCVRTDQKASIPHAVSMWVGGGYFFTSSTIFANPAVTIGRMFSDTFTGIHPKSAGMFIIFQVIGAVVGFSLSRFFYPSREDNKKKKHLPS